MANFVALSGYITRQNLNPPQPDLEIQVDPYWLLPGDDSEIADMTTGLGLDVALSTLKSVWADSPYVAGKELVLATPDNSVLDLRLIIDGASFADLMAKVAPIIQAVRQQISFQVSVSFDGWTSTWNCYTGDYRVATNQLFYFGYLCPLYLSLPRHPIPVAGPI